jgi:pSer/pThr/pTyr-binding forkhead associated (FHA) protein
MMSWEDDRPATAEPRDADRPAAADRGRAGTAPAPLDEEEGAATVMMRAPGPERRRDPPPPTPAPEPEDPRTMIAPPISAGLSGARLVMVAGSRPGLQFSLARTVTSIGRSVACQVTLNDEQANPQHAVIRRQGQQWVLHDAAGGDRTYVNGAPVCEMHELRHGDTIRVGATSLRFEIGEVEDKGAVP